MVKQKNKEWLTFNGVDVYIRNRNTSTPQKTRTVTPGSLRDLVEKYLEQHPIELPQYVLDLEDIEC